MDKKAVDERLRLIEEQLADYESKCGMPVLSGKSSDEESADELYDYLSMSRDELEKLTAEDCWQIAVILSQFSFYLQRKTNVEQSRINFLEDEVYRVCSKLMDNYSKYDKFDVKIWQIASDNSYVARLLELKSNFKARLDRLNFLSSSVKNIADLMNRNVKAKYERERNN